MRATLPQGRDRACRTEFQTSLSGPTNYQNFSPTEDTPHHEGATHRQSLQCWPNATGTTETDPTRPPRPNASDNGTGWPLGGEDDGQPHKVLATTQQPHTRTRRNRANQGKTRATGNKLCRGQPTATKHGQPGPYGPPHNPGGANYWRPRQRQTNTTRRARPGRTTTATSDRPATTNLVTGREDNQRDIRLHQRGLQCTPPYDAPANHKAADTTGYQPNYCRKKDPTINKPHASWPTPNQPSMQGSKRERRPMRWRHHDAPCPPTTVPTNAPQRRDSEIKQPSNQPQRPTSNLRPPRRAQARPSQEA